MARGKPKSPGDNSSRGGVHGSHSIWSLRRVGLKAMEIKSNREEISASRRTEVYKADPELFAPETSPDRIWRVPRKGTPERAELEAKIEQGVKDGRTHLDIATELEIEVSMVSTLVTRNRWVGPRSRKFKEES